MAMERSDFLGESGQVRKERAVKNHARRKADYAGLVAFAEDALETTATPKLKRGLRTLVYTETFDSLSGAEKEAMLLLAAHYYKLKNKKEG